VAAAALACADGTVPPSRGVCVTHTGARARAKLETAEYPARSVLLLDGPLAPEDIQRAKQAVAGSTTERVIRVGRRAWSEVLLELYLRLTTASASLGAQDGLTCARCCGFLCVIPASWAIIVVLLVTDGALFLGAGLVAVFDVARWFASTGGRVVSPDTLLAVTVPHLRNEGLTTRCKRPVVLQSTRLLRLQIMQKQRDVFALPLS
jgi:hypothetical protein